jgi:type III secretory pathway component EscT
MPVDLPKKPGKIVVLLPGYIIAGLCIGFFIGLLFYNVSHVVK